MQVLVCCQCCDMIADLIAIVSVPQLVCSNALLCWHWVLHLLLCHALSSASDHVPAASDQAVLCCLPPEGKEGACVWVGEFAPYRK